MKSPNKSSHTANDADITSLVKKLSHAEVKRLQKRILAFLDNDTAEAARLNFNETILAIDESKLYPGDRRTLEAYKNLLVAHLATDSDSQAGELHDEANFIGGIEPHLEEEVIRLAESDLDPSDVTDRKQSEIRGNVGSAISHSKMKRSSENRRIDRKIILDSERTPIPPDVLADMDIEFGK